MAERTTSQDVYVAATEFVLAQERQPSSGDLANKYRVVPLSVKGAEEFRSLQVRIWDGEGERVRCNVALIALLGEIVTICTVTLYANATHPVVRRETRELHSDSTNPDAPPRTTPFGRAIPHGARPLDITAAHEWLEEATAPIPH